MILSFVFYMFSPSIRLLYFSLSVTLFGELIIFIHRQFFLKIIFNYFFFIKIIYFKIIIIIIFFYI